jgi:hypothetical protein
MRLVSWESRHDRYPPASLRSYRRIAPRMGKKLRLAWPATLLRFLILFAAPHPTCRPVGQDRFHQ